MSRGSQPTSLVVVKQDGLVISKKPGGGLRYVGTNASPGLCAAPGRRAECVTGSSAHLGPAVPLPIHLCFLHIWVMASRAEEATPGDQLQLMK